MPRANPDRTPEAPDGARSARELRELLALTEHATELGVRAVPGKAWGLHYPRGGRVREERLAALHDGRATPEEAAPDLAPDAFVFDVRDLSTIGFDALRAKIRDVSVRVHYDDPLRLARFVAADRGASASMPELLRAYDRVAAARARAAALEAYGPTGQRQLREAIHEDCAGLAAALPGLPPAEQIFGMLQLHWANESLNLIDPETVSAAKAVLPERVRDKVELLRSAYEAFVREGSEDGFEDLCRGLRTIMSPAPELPQPEQAPPGAQPPTGQPPQPAAPADAANDDLGGLPPLTEEERQRTEELIQEFQQQDIGLPGQPNDPAIPPDAQKRYDTPPPLPEPAPEEASGQQGPAESREQPERVYFEITPKGTATAALTGYFLQGRNSLFDRATKYWENGMRTAPYATAITGTERWQMRGSVDTGLKALPVPSGYAVDAASVRTDNGATVELLRDDQGCFYFQASRPCTLELDMLHEAAPVMESPTVDDLIPLGDVPLSPATEAALAAASGTHTEIALALQRHVVSTHVYPGGGDLRAAQALQYRLRQAPADQYPSAIDASEELECYSANTHLIDLLRRKGVPARLGLGHHVEGARAGVAKITDRTGHAWVEFYDESGVWRRLDGTPPARPNEQPPQDAKMPDKGDEQTPTQNADDGGIDAPPPPRPGQQPGQEQGHDQQQQSQPGEGDSPGESGEPSESSESSSASQSDASDAPPEAGEAGTPPQPGLPEADDADFADAERQMQEAMEQLERAENQRERLRNEMSAAESFKDLQDLQDELAREDILDDVKEELERKLEDAIEARKQELRDRLEQLDDDGFIEDEDRRRLEEALESDDLRELEQLEGQIEVERELHLEYQEIAAEVRPKVEKWFRHFVKRLPKESQPEAEDSLTRGGALNRHSVKRLRNLVFGTVKNPRMFHEFALPLFIAKIVVDVSGSMNGAKLLTARKMLVFYLELFTKICRTFGFFRFSVSAFSDGILTLKDFNMEYDSRRRYDFASGDGVSRAKATVKARLMRDLVTRGGTNMLPALQEAGRELSKELEDHPGYLTALYFMGDGEDTCGNSANVRRYLEMRDGQRGFGNHLRSAVLLGSEHERATLAGIFGDEHTAVASDFDALIDQSMHNFDRDVQQYMKRRKSR